MERTPGYFTADLAQCKVRNAGGGPIAAGLSNGCKSLKEMHGNMVLFAASPRMLAVLQRAIDECPFVVTPNECECSESMGVAVCVHMEMVAAIQLAEGK